VHARHGTFFLAVLTLVGCSLMTVGCKEDAPAVSVDITAAGQGTDAAAHDLAMGDNTPHDQDGRPFLHPSDTGASVLSLQKRLVILGAHIQPDGAFGDETLDAVLQFQKAQGLPADGVVGTATWAALDAPAKPVEWARPDVPDTFSTDAPSTTAEPTSQKPSSAPAPAGDGAVAEPEAAPSNDPAAGPGAWAKAVVSLSHQTATFFDSGGNVVLQAPISSGAHGLTPVGTFHVQSKSTVAYAGGNSGVYMNSMVRFNGGIGFHSIPKHADTSDFPTPLGEKPVSHGCVRMADDQAKIVFDHLPIGALVEIQQ
jgi:peptidoglycan hydrolase-like protein with peptidoglycan-binding domain